MLIFIFNFYIEFRTPRSVDPDRACLGWGCAYDSSTCR